MRGCTLTTRAVNTLPNAPEPVGGFDRQAPLGTPIEASERVRKFEFEFEFPCAAVFRPKLCTHARMALKQIPSKIRWHLQTSELTESLRLFPVIAKDHGRPRQRISMKAKHAGDVIA
jgi:hypothetical protein